MYPTLAGDLLEWVQSHAGDAELGVLVARVVEEAIGLGNHCNAGPGGAADSFQFSSS